MRKTLLFFLLLWFFLPAAAQEGAPLLTHFREDPDIENQSWAICQDRNRVMLFANRKGILAFDGTEDRITVRTQITPYVMEINPVDGRIYIGGESDYGFLERDGKGIYRYESLSGNAGNLGTITRITFNDSIACFSGKSSVSSYNFLTNRLSSRFLSSADRPFSGVILSGNKTYINVSKQGLYRVEADSLHRMETGYLTVNNEIIFSLPYDSRRVLVGLSSGKISLFDGTRYAAFPLNDGGYIEKNMLSGGISIGDSLYAFSTMGGGAVVTGKTGKVRFMINNRNGLPDDEIFAMGFDASGGLWLSHPLGLTRADLRLPVGNYGIYEGLTGNLSTAVRYRGELYVATSDGVFYLAPEKYYEEVQLLRNEVDPVKMSMEIQKETPPARIRPSKQDENPRKSLFDRLFGKKPGEVAKEDEATGGTVFSGGVNVQAVPEIRYRTDTIRTLKSITFVYKKVAGLNEKCRQLVPTENGVLAATNMGLYVIRDYKAELLAENRYINAINWRPYNGSYAIAASDGYFIADNRKGKWIIDIPDKNFRNPVYSIVRTGQNTYWLGSDNSAYYSYTGDQNIVSYSKFTIGNGFSQRYLVRMVNDTVFLFTDTSVSIFDEAAARFIPHMSGNLQTDGIDVFGYPVSNLPLLVRGNDWLYPEMQKRINERSLSLLKIFENVISVFYENDNILVVDGENRLFGIESSKGLTMTPETYLFIKNIRNERGISFSLSDIVFEGGDNVINFDIVAPAYHRKNLTKYQFFIDGIMGDWSSWSMKTNYNMALPKAGSYILQVRAMDIWGHIGEPVSVNFTIKAPFTKTTPFFVLSGVTVLIIVLLLVYFRERSLQEKNRILEEKVRERTAEIEAQKEEITASISYASRIQLAMLPMSNLFADSFADSFIIYKPRDIVSGDFYWIGEDDKNIYLTVADCTGHGVPGAFMSTLGISILNEIVTHNRNLQANIFLNLLRDKIKMLLHQTGKEGEAADGMDISLCVLCKSRKKLQYAGAYSPLFIHSNGTLKEFKADRMPIGIHYGCETPFKNHEIDIFSGDVIYLLSDGLTDQFGGDEGSKYKKAQFKKLLSKIHNLPMSEQQNHIEEEFVKWRGGYEQVDDITVIGVRI
jgi:serine phosphatase RsbU (regulator of sigma subunit)